MLISYILVGFNSRRFVPACLGSILADAPADAEVLFIDNASADGTANLVAAEFPSVRLFRNDTNVGHCGATNQGLRAARGRYIIILDTDTELPPGTTSILIDFLQKHPDVRAAAPRMLNADGTIQETARNFPSIINALFGRQTLLARLFPNNRFTLRYLGRENIHRDEPFAVEWVSAACMIVPRRTVEEVGPWDEGYAGYWVDCDWCRQIQDAGGPIYCVPAARVWHYEQNRVGVKKSLHRIRLFNQGARRFFIKHHTCGGWDPRAWVATVLLALRAAMQVVANAFAHPEPKANKTISATGGTPPGESAE